MLEMELNLFRTCMGTIGGSPVIRLAVPEIPDLLLGGVEGIGLGGVGISSP